MSNKLKMLRCFKKGYVRYSFLSSPSELSNDVMKVCKILSKGMYVVEIFSRDKLNDLAFKNVRYIGCKKNFRYYLLDDMNFLRDINIADMRYIGIYSISEIRDENTDPGFLMRDSAFCICFENYLDFGELLICKDKYTQDPIDLLKAL